MTGEGGRRNLTELFPVQHSPALERRLICVRLCSIAEPHVQRRGLHDHAGRVCPLAAHRPASVLGVGDASGMFPIDSDDWRLRQRRMAGALRRALRRASVCAWKLAGDSASGCCRAGEAAGTLTEAGAQLLDPTGHAGGGQFPSARRRATRARAWPPPTAWPSVRAMCPLARPYSP